MGGSEQRRAGKERVPRNSLNSIRLAKVMREGTERRVGSGSAARTLSPAALPNTMRARVASA
jgi:hypothetical protein